MSHAILKNREIDMDHKNIVWHHSAISKQDRETLNGHQGVTIWFTGLSSSGKSTIGHGLERQLHQNKIRSFVLDGDNIRHGLCKDLGFSDRDRCENIRRIGELSCLMMEAGLIVLTAFISPFTKDRRIVRQLVGAENFIEVYCAAPLSVCEERDVKGLYKKARCNEIKQFTGISSPYETPENPNIILETDKLSVQASVDTIFSYLKQKRII